MQVTRRTVQAQPEQKFEIAAQMVDTVRGNVAPPFA
jgi:hypothetical protein